MVDTKIEQFAMHEEDLEGFSIGDVACISCRPLCTNKVTRRYHGGPLFMCTRKEATKEVLSREYARMHGDDEPMPDAEASGSGVPGPGEVPPPGQALTADKALTPGEVPPPGQPLHVEH